MTGGTVTAPSGAALSPTLRQDTRGILRDGVLTFHLPDAPPDQGPSELDGELQYRPDSVGIGISHCEPVQGICGGSVRLPDHGPSVPISIR